MCLCGTCRCVVCVLGSPLADWLSCVYRADPVRASGVSQQHSRLPLRLGVELFKTLH